MKRCPRCKVTKGDSKFYRNPNTGKLHSHCRPCRKEWEREHRAQHRADYLSRQTEWRKANPDKARDYLYRWRAKNPEKLAAVQCRSYVKHRQNRIDWESERREKIRQEVFAAYGGFICACCGETEPMFMTIDHIDNDGAKHRRELKTKIGKGGASFFYWLKTNKFPKGFQVLCRNCNWGKHANGGVCPHITSSEGSTTRAAARSAKRHEARSTVQLASGDDIVSSAWRHAAARNGRVVQ